MIGIIGLGFVGSAIQESLTRHALPVVCYDRYKNGGIGSLEACAAPEVTLLFLCLPTPYDPQSRSYDISALRETCTVLQNLSFRGLVVLKSTVLPGTTEGLAHDFPGLSLCHNPEFLKARQATEDFHTHQKAIVIGRATGNENVEALVSLYRTYYCALLEDKIVLCRSTESELMKLACNSFYATKIQFLNEVHASCGVAGVSYETVRDLMLRQERIHPADTAVPGPDGLFSYGGACFPKDTMAFWTWMERKGVPHAVLRSVTEERDSMRKD